MQKRLEILVSARPGRARSGSGTGPGPRRPAQRGAAANPPPSAPLRPLHTHTNPFNRPPPPVSLAVKCKSGILLQGVTLHRQERQAAVTSPPPPTTTTATRLLPPFSPAKARRRRGAVPLPPPPRVHGAAGGVLPHGWAAAQSARTAGVRGPPRDRLPAEWKLPRQAPNACSPRLHSAPKPNANPSASRPRTNPPPRARARPPGRAEPGSGSDAAAMRTVATPADGGWLISGSKAFIRWAVGAARLEEGGVLVCAAKGVAAAGQGGGARLHPATNPPQPSARPVGPGRPNLRATPPPNRAAAAAPRTCML